MGVTELSEAEGTNRNTLTHRRRWAVHAFPDLPWLQLSQGPHDQRAANTQRAPQEGGEGSYYETIETHADGSQVSDKLISLDAEQEKDPTYLLIAHGYDPAEWELVNAKCGRWHGLTKDGLGKAQRTMLYTSRITVRPRVRVVEWDDIVAGINAAVVPVVVEQPERGEQMLELGYTDMHFGNSTLEHYRWTLARSIRRIESQKWQQVVIWLGSDLFHCDNFKNTTSNGTQQSSVWWPQAIEDCAGFMGAVIESALANAAEVYVYYVPGNHDESMAWMFAMTLQYRYPQATFDVRIAERKVHLFGECAVGMTHGDEKTRKDLDRVFSAEFPEFSSSKHREVHMGHLHHQEVIDRFGVTSRSLATAARTDKWHRESGYVGARKAFQFFVWDADFGVTDCVYV